MLKKIRRRAALLCAAALMLQQFTPAGRYSAVNAQASMDSDEQVWETEEIGIAAEETIQEEETTSDHFMENDEPAVTDAEEDAEGDPGGEEQEDEYDETEKQTLAEDTEETADATEIITDESLQEQAGNEIPETEPDEIPVGEINSTDADSENPAEPSGEELSAEGSERCETKDGKTIA